MSGWPSEGEVPWDPIADLVAGELPPVVVLGPAVAEDAAQVDLGGEADLALTDLEALARSPELVLE